MYVFNPHIVDLTEDVSAKSGQKHHVVISLDVLLRFRRFGSSIFHLGVTPPLIEENNRRLNDYIKREFPRRREI